MKEIGLLPDLFHLSIPFTTLCIEWQPGEQSGTPIAGLLLKN